MGVSFHFWIFDTNCVFSFFITHTTCSLFQHVRKLTFWVQFTSQGSGPVCQRTSGKQTEGVLCDCMSWQVIGTDETWVVDRQKNPYRSANRTTDRCINLTSVDAIPLSWNEVRHEGDQYLQLFVVFLLVATRSNKSPAAAES